MTETNETDCLPCGHPRGRLVQDGGGMAHRAWCEEVARLRELIPDAALLLRLADYASYDFTNQPPSFEDARQKLHADAAAARELAGRIEEANVAKKQR